MVKCGHNMVFSWVKSGDDAHINTEFVCRVLCGVVSIQCGAAVSSSGAQQSGAPNEGVDCDVCAVSAEVNSKGIIVVRVRNMCGSYNNVLKSAGNIK